MTHDDHPTPSADDWEGALAQAFGEVLGRPLTSYDRAARYGAYYDGNFLAETELDRDPAWVGRAALAGAEPVGMPHLLLTPPGDLDHPALVFDASRSWFAVDTADLPAGFAADLDALPAAAEGLALGADLGRLADRHRIDLASPDLPAGAWTVWRARIASGSTLLDALRAATGLGDATGPADMPPGLGDSADAVADEAHERVAAVADERLRDYLAAFCDPESHDLAFCLDETEQSEEETEGRLVARWRGAVDQYDVSVWRVAG